MAETQLASMFIGNPNIDDEESQAERGSSNNIFILDGQTDEVLGHINKKYVIDNEHEKDLPSHKDYFRFTVLADNEHAEHLNKRNGLIVPGEDGELLEFRIFESIKYRDNEGLKIEVHALATYLDLKTQKIFDPHKTEPETALQHANLALSGTEWKIGQVDFKGIRTLTFDNPFNSYNYILRIAREFELEPRFYIETDGNKVTGRYIDLVEQVGEFRGRTIEFGRDLQRIERKEDTSNVVTALWVYGPEREDGTRLKMFVEDDEARQRWGRRGQHIIDYYEPQTENQDITEERLKTLGEMELRKRINAVVTYEAEILDLENVPGLENKKIRFGDTIRIKDVYFNPPLYVEARAFNIKRDVFNKSRKTVQLGDYREYTEEEVKALFRQMQAEIRRRLERLVLVSIISSSGNVFKNGVGSTELTAKTFLSGNEVDEDGTKYEYRWHKFDKNGDYVPGFYEEGKTITVNASVIDEKATFRVEIILDDEVLTVHEITLTNVFDGEDGEEGPQGPPGQDGYTPIKGVDYFDGEDGQDGKSSYLWVRYSHNANGNPMTTDPTNAKYIGVATTETPSAPPSYTSYQWSLIKGQDGIPGEDGEDGKTSYLHIKYSNDGGQTFTGNNGEDVGDWIGTYVDFIEADSNNPSDYTWNKVKGEKGEKGENGSDGRGIVSATVTYQLHTNGTTAPTGTWHTNPPTPVKGRYLWTRTVTTYTDNSNITTYSVAYLATDGQKGEDGKGITSTTVRYQISTSGTTVPTGTWSSSVPSPIKGRYLWTRTVITYSDNTTSTSYSTSYYATDGQKGEKGDKGDPGKDGIAHMGTTPPNNPATNATWFQTDSSGKVIAIKKYNGSSWETAKMDAETLGVVKLSAISADLGNVTAGHIEGVTMNLGNDQFVVDSGNVKFAGHLEGATGSFNGKLSSVQGVESVEIENARVVGKAYYSGNNTTSEFTLSVGELSFITYAGNNTNFSNALAATYFDSNGFYHYGSGDKNIIDSIIYFQRLPNDTTQMNISATGGIHFGSSVTGTMIRSDTFGSNLGVSMLRQHSNGNVTLEAASGGVLILGYGGTTRTQIGTASTYLNSRAELYVDEDYFRLRSKTGQHNGSIVFTRSTDGIAFYQNGSFRHTFNPNGTKIGGSYEFEDGTILGMSPVDSPQTLIEYIEFDVPLSINGTKVYLDDRYRQAVYSFAIFSNNGEVVEKGYDYFIIKGTGTADVRIVGERKGEEGNFWADMSAMTEDFINEIE